MKKIKALKTKLRKPNLKFNVVAHSMGGLVTRYAAMYGDTDLRAENRVRRGRAHAILTGFFCSERPTKVQPNR